MRFGGDHPVTFFSLGCIGNGQELLLKVALSNTVVLQ
jgi:hypothetical protein